MSEEAAGVLNVEQPAGSRSSRQSTRTGYGAGEQPPVNLKDLLPDRLGPILDNEEDLLKKKRSELIDFLDQMIKAEDKFLADWGAASKQSPLSPSLDDYTDSEIRLAKEWLDVLRARKQSELEDLEENRTLIQNAIDTMGELARSKAARISSLIAQLKTVPQQRDELKKLIDKLNEDLRDPPDDQDLVNTITTSLTEANAALKALDTAEGNYIVEIGAALDDWRLARGKIKNLVAKEDDGGLQDLAFKIDKAKKDLENMKKYEGIILRKHLQGS